MIALNEKIRVPLKELTTRRDCEVKEGYLLLLEDHIKYKMVATYESNDNEATIFKKYKSNWRFTRRRDDISSVEMGYDNEEACYFVTIEFSGVADSNRWNYDDPQEALKLFNTLEEYFTSTPK